MVKKNYSYYVMLLLALAVIITGTGCRNSLKQQNVAPQQDSVQQKNITAQQKDAQLQNLLHDYTEIICGKLPEDICLTIYYLDSNIYTRIPLSKEDLMTFPGVKVIKVGYEKLASHQESFKKIDSTILTLAPENSYMNARLYYFIETCDSGKVLEVVWSSFDNCVFVNGVAVKNDPIFRTVVTPFLKT